MNAVLSLAAVRVPHLYLFDTPPPFTLRQRYTFSLQTCHLHSHQLNYLDRSQDTVLLNPCALLRMLSLATKWPKPHSFFA